MRKVMVFLTVFMLALLAGAEEAIQLEIAKGQSVGSVYYAHPEVQVGLYPYSLEYRATWEKLNQVEDFNLIQPGQYLFPIKAKEVETTPSAVTLATTKEVVEPEALDPEEVLQMFLVTSEQERDALQGKVAGLTTQLEELPKVKSKLEQKQAEVKGLELKLSSQDALMAQTIEQHKKEIASLPKNQPATKPSLPTLPLSTAYVVGSGLIIATLVVVIIGLFWKVSRFSNERLRLQNNLGHIRDQLEKEFAERIERITRELNREKRKAGRMRRLLEPHWFSFFCPKISRVGSKEDLYDEAFFPIEGWMPDGTPLIQIAGVKDLVPATCIMIEGAIRSEAHQNTETPYLLPNQAQIQRRNQLAAAS